MGAPVVFSIAIGTADGTNPNFSAPSKYVTGTIVAWVSNAQRFELTEGSDLTSFILDPPPSTGDSVFVYYTAQEGSRATSRWVWRKGNGAGAIFTIPPYTPGSVLILPRGLPQNYASGYETDPANGTVTLPEIIEDGDDILFIFTDSTGQAGLQITGALTQQFITGSITQL